MIRILSIMVYGSNLAGRSQPRVQGTCLRVATNPGPIRSHPWSGKVRSYMNTRNTRPPTFSPTTTAQKPRRSHPTDALSVAFASGSSLRNAPSIALAGLAPKNAKRHTSDIRSTAVHLRCGLTSSKDSSVATTCGGQQDRASDIVVAPARASRARR